MLNSDTVSVSSTVLIKGVLCRICSPLRLRGGALLFLALIGPSLLAIVEHNCTGTGCVPVAAIQRVVDTPVLRMASLSFGADFGVTGSALLHDLPLHTAPSSGRLRRTWADTEPIGHERDETAHAAVARRNPQAM